MDLLKEWRVWIFILIVLGSVLAIAPNPWASGVVVKNIDQNSPFIQDISPGEKIISINDVPIESSSDMIQFENYTGVIRIFHNGELTLKDVDGNIGIEVRDVTPTNLNMGMDLVGGTRVLLKPVYSEDVNKTNETLSTEQIISTLQTRMNVYGLKEINFQSVRDVRGNNYIQIEMAGASKEEIDDLLEREGVFEAFIPRLVNFRNGSGAVELGDKNFTIEKEGQNITFGNNVFGVNDTLSLNDIEFDVWNITNQSAVLSGKIFTTEDIKYVYFDSQHSYIRKYGSGWEFSFQILVSDDGAERFAKVTEDIPVVIDPKTGESYLERKIYLFLDETPMDDLRIGSGLAGKAYSTPQITGGGVSEEDTSSSMRRLQSILSSGALPVELEAIRVDSISPSLGSQFIRGVLLAGFGALIAVSLVISIRYKNWKIVLPILITSLSEIVIILGVASFIRWTIDLAAIAGIIAAVGTGVDHQIIITDEVSSGKELAFSLKEKIKRAFFIIFGTASTTIAAMLPLGIIGIGVMRGFAITTIIGVLVGIFITRPAYSKIIEKLDLV